jgi:four helix bundle protein
VDVRRQQSAVRRQVEDQKSDSALHGAARDQRADVRSRTRESNMSNTKSERIESAKDLRVYKLAYELAMQIFELTKEFPSEEKYALTSQIRRSSRSICLNLREAWAKRRYEAHFVSKITDCDGENSESDSALDFAKDCGYISTEQHKQLIARCAEIGRMLHGMIKKSESFLIADL